MIKKQLNKLMSRLSTDIAMDLGTANTLVYIRDKGIVLNEPSVVAVSANGTKVEAVGLEAKRMFGRTNSELQTIRPMKDGVIADFNVTNRMITYFINKTLKKNWFIKPRIVIGVPTCITQVEKKAVIESALMSGVRDVSLVEEPMAAAIGADIPVHKAEGNMVIDIGGGTSDIAVISLSAIAYGESIRLAGDAIDEAIVRYIRLNHHLSIGIFEGERVKVEIGSAYPTIDRLTTEVKGLNVKTGVPTSVTVSDDEIRGVTKDHSYVQALVDEGKITQAEAREHPKKNIITKAVGISPSIEADKSILTLGSDESLLLCCDGVIAHLPDEDIHKIINDSPDPQSACQKIVDTANERGGSDNISLIILSAGGPDTKENESDDSPTVINS